MKAVAALAIAVTLASMVTAQAQSWSGRTPYQELETTPRWQNPYSKRERSEYREPREYESSGGVRQGRGHSDITGFKREPLGGGSWMDRVR